MDDVGCDLLGAVEAAGVRTELRMWRNVPAHAWAPGTPVSFLSYGLNPKVALWARKMTPRPTRFALRGPVNFWPRDSSWEMKSNGLPALSILSFFSDDLFDDVADFDASGNSIGDPSISESMRHLYEEIRSPGFGSTILVESISNFLRVKIMRLANGCGGGNCLDIALGKVELGLIRDYVEARHGSMPTVSDLARLCRMSRRSLLRRFKETTGKTVSRYIADVQISRSKRLLAASSLRINEVAYDIGFASPGNFTCAFKRQVGMTPTQYRCAAREG